MSKKNKGKGETKVINLIRFAYDIFRYSALKFNVQSQSIPEWEGPENDYGCSDFILVVSRLVFKHQINFRTELNAFFKSHYEPHMRNSLEHIKELFRKVLIGITSNTALGLLTHVEYSLAGACELIQFLYSEDSNFFLVQLAELWFQFYLEPNKTKFKKRGGLNRMYKNGKEMQRDIPDAFINTFILAFGADYQTSVKMYLFDRYHDSVMIYKQKRGGKHAEPSEDPPLEIDLPRFIYHSAQQEDAGVSLPLNPLLGVAPPNEMYSFPLAGDAPPSQDIPEANVQDLSKRTRRSSYKDRKRNRAPRSRCSMEQLSPDPSMAPDATKSYEHLGARPKDPPPEPSGSCSSGAERLGRLSLDSPRKQDHIKERTISTIAKYLNPSKKSREAQIQLQCARFFNLPKNVDSSERQDIGQLSSDSSVISSSEGKSDILADDILDNPDEIPQESTKEHSESSGEEDTEEK